MSEETKDGVGASDSDPAPPSDASSARSSSSRPPTSANPTSSIPPVSANPPVSLRPGPSAPPRPESTPPSAEGSAPVEHDIESTRAAMRALSEEEEHLGSKAEPIRAMRVIKLEQASRRPPAPSAPPGAPESPEPERLLHGSSPAIETAAATFEEIEEDLSDDEIAALSESPPAPSPAPPSLSPEALSLDEAEEVDAVEEVVSVERPPEPEIPPADRKPPPPRRSAKPSLPRASHPRHKPWWETLFGDDFSRAYRPMTEKQLAREVDFILSSLDLPPGSVILDLGCGQGEICVELSRRGYSVVGYDLSVYQLAMAGDNAQTARQKINFLQGDMREMAFEQMFDAVLCWDTTFGYFEEEKNIEVLGRIRQALKPSGRFLLDVMNRDFAAKEAPYNHWFEGDGCVCMDDMGMDWITNRLKIKRSIILDDGRSKELQYSVRLYTLSEVGRMLHEAGFRVAAVSGDIATRGAFFGPASRRIIIQAGKP